MKLSKLSNIQKKETIPVAANFSQVSGLLRKKRFGGLLHLYYISAFLMIVIYVYILFFQQTKERMLLRDQNAGTLGRGDAG